MLPHLAASLLELYLDEEDEADQRHHDKERQEDSHVKILRGLQEDTATGKRQHILEYAGNLTYTKYDYKLYKIQLSLWGTEMSQRNSQTHLL